jgi:hypothetical protein
MKFSLETPRVLSRTGKPLCGERRDHFKRLIEKSLLPMMIAGRSSFERCEFDTTASPTVLLLFVYGYTFSVTGIQFTFRDQSEHKDHTDLLDH